MLVQMLIGFCSMLCACTVGPTCVIEERTLVSLRAGTCTTSKGVTSANQRRPASQRMPSPHLLPNRFRDPRRPATGRYGSNVYHKLARPLLSMTGCIYVHWTSGGLACPWSNPRCKGLCRTGAAARYKIVCTVVDRLIVFCSC